MPRGGPTVPARPRLLATGRRAQRRAERSLVRHAPRRSPARRRFLLATGRCAPRKAERSLAQHGPRPPPESSRTADSQRSSGGPNGAREGPGTGGGLLPVGRSAVPSVREGSRARKRRHGGRASCRSVGSAWATGPVDPRRPRAGSRKGRETASVFAASPSVMRRAVRLHEALRFTDCLPVCGRLIKVPCENDRNQRNWKVVVERTPVFTQHEETRPESLRQMVCFAGDVYQNRLIGSLGQGWSYTCRAGAKRSGSFPGGRLVTAIRLCSKDFGIS